MRGGWCAFALGVGLLQCQAALPGTWWLMALAGWVALWLTGWRFLRRRSHLRAAWCALCIAAASSGFGYAALRAQLRLSEVLPARLEGREIDVSGWITGLPSRHAHGVSFNLIIDEHVVRRLRVPAKVQLNWSSWGGAEVPALAPGAHWRMRVRLRRPYAHANPGVSDFEAMWLARGIRARGQVVAPQRAQRLDASRKSFVILIDSLRNRLAARIAQVLADAPRQGIVTALAIGEQGDITPEDRDVLSRTGTLHLVAASGSHVALAGGLCAWCAAFVWRRTRWRGLAGPLRWPAQKAGALGMLAGSGVYAALAGFNLPIQRACWMAGAAALTVIGGRRIAPSTSLILALAVVLLVDPWAVLAPGFWLSFVAVAAILLTLSSAATSRAEAGRRRLARARHALMAAARVQCAVTLMLAPLTIGWFAQTSLISPLANALAIPWMEMLSMPCALVGVMLPAPLDAWALRLAHASLEPLMRVLEWMAAWPHAQAWVPVPDNWIVALSLGAAGWLLAPRGWPLRWAMPWCWLPLTLPLLVPVDAVPPGVFRLTALDVGQGPAVLVDTARHRLLFGAGSGRAGADSVVPYLHAQGVSRLDAVIAPHPGATRAESLNDVLEALPAGRLYRPCVTHDPWTWDDVKFEIFGVPSGRCVLRVSAGGRAALLTGDLDARSERALVGQHGPALAAGVLLAPRQGSRAASSEPFLDAVAPHLTVIQVAYPNRFGYPAPEVLARYRAHGATVLRTDRQGAIRIVVPAGAGAPQTWRAEHRRYWMGL